MIKTFKTLDFDKFQFCGFTELKIGDIVMSQTYTNSQKYLDKFGYEEYNMTKIGIFIEKNNEVLELSNMLKYDQETDSFIRESLFSNPGTSGGYYFKRYVE
jgi:hypothetical protein